MAELLASIELGGTKTIVACAHDPAQLLARVQVPTGDPAAMHAQVADALATMSRTHGPIGAIGFASFGPVDIRHGRMLPTPKPGWSGAELVAPLAARFGCPITFDTDVNAAAIAEAALGAGRGSTDLAYVTIGTGIGAGLLLDGAPRHGVMHPEVGHLRPRRHPEDEFAGTCPWHGDCIEGLACGPAIQARLGAPLDTLGPDHPFREILADYLGQLTASLLLVTSVDRIVMGGGVLRNLGLHARIETRTRDYLAGYLGAIDALDRFLFPPELEDAGLIGGLLMAQATLTGRRL